MEYAHLTPNDFAGLERERVTTLEGEHYRLTLLLRETDGNSGLAAQLTAQQADIERRITLHTMANELKHDPTPTGASD